MAVTFDAKCTADSLSNSATTITNANLTVGSGSNRALVALLAFGAVTLPTGITVTWDSGGTNQAMTQITNATAASSAGSTVLFGLLNPTSGTKTLSASWTGASEVTLASVSFTLVDQTSIAVAFPHGNGATGSSTTPSVTITSATGNMTVASFQTNLGNINSTNGNNIFIDNNGTICDSAGNYITGAASVNLTASISLSGTWIAAGTDILASSSADVLSAQIWV